MLVCTRDTKRFEPNTIDKITVWQAIYAAAFRPYLSRLKVEAQVAEALITLPQHKATLS